MTQDEEAFFEEFYRANYQKFVGYAFRFLRNWEDAKEVTQDAFLIGLVKIKQFYASENRPGWLKNTIRKRAQNFNKVKINRAAVTTFLEDPGLSLAAPDHYNRIDSPSAYCAELLTEQEFLLREYSATTNRKGFKRKGRKYGIISAREFRKSKEKACTYRGGGADV